MPSRVALLNLQKTQAPVSLTITLLPQISTSSQSPPSRRKFGRISSITSVMSRIRSASAVATWLICSDSTSMILPMLLDGSQTNARVTCQPNDLPQEQLDVAFGFSKVKPAPSSATTKSIVAPASNSWLFISTNTFTPSRSTTVSSASASLTRPITYL